MRNNVQINFGIDTAFLAKGQRQPVIWDTKKLINGHMLLVGKSGTGKTHTLKKILKQMIAQSSGKMRVHVMDVHGDIDIEGASTVKFSESTPYGFNPLSINPDPDFGGVRKRVQSFIAALSRTGFRLGPKQEATLRNILVDLYAANGFYENDSKSWNINDGVQRRYPKKQPTMKDAVFFAQSKLKSMFLGTSSKTVSALEKLYKKQGQLIRLKKEINKSSGDVSEREKLEVDLQNASEEAIGLFKEHLEHLQTGTELTDLLKYDSKDVMKSVVDRLENLNSIGIFRPERPPFDPRGTIWRYDIKALSGDEKKLFVSFILEAIFLRAAQRGVQEDVVEIIVLDEAHLFLTDDPDNPINMIAKEARKFGLGLFAASQSPTHFSDDFLSNVGTKIILGIDQMYWDGAVRKLKLENAALEWIIPHQRMVMQMNNRGATKNRFQWVALEKD
jgi:DNA helicase HerA-like ATPase